MFIFARKTPANALYSEAFSLYFFAWVNLAFIVGFLAEKCWTLTQGKPTAASKNSCEHFFSSIIHSKWSVRRWWKRKLSKTVSKVVTLKTRRF